MKNTLYLLGLLLFSCSPKITEKENKVATFILSAEEKIIVNDFLDIELASDTYKNYKNLEIVLIEETRNRIWPLDAYEYAYKDWHSLNTVTPDDNQRLGWVLDSMQLKELKNKYQNEEPYHWNPSDIKNHKVAIMKYDTLTNNIRTSKNIKMPEKLILFITVPILIDQNNALISFNSSSDKYGNSINRITVLMKKTNGKWKMGPSYWDGMMD